MNRLTLAALAVMAGSVTAPAYLSGQAHAQPVPNCGGQGATPRDVPYTCVLPPKVIDGTAFSAVVHADGTTVTVTINLAEPRQVDTPARIVHHVGISGAGGLSDRAQGVIPAGQTSITLVDSAPCTDGQLDVKVWHVGPGQPEGRVGGPWIRNGTDCQTPPTPAPLPPASSLPVPPTAPPATTPGVSLPPGSGASPTLPATGAGWDAAGWAIVTLLVGGVTLIAVAGRKRPVS